MRPSRGAEKRNRAEGIARDLRVRILSGEHRPGDRLPTEQALAEAFGVNRATLREAVKKLEMLGLITVRQRAGIRVRDYWADSGLELLGYLLEAAIETDRLDVDLLADVLEARRLFYAEVARLTALRADDARIEELEAHVEAVHAASDPVGFLAADLALVTCLARSADNAVIRLLFNSFANLYRDHVDLFAAFYADRLEQRKPFYDGLLAAVRAHDSEAAARLARESFEADDEAVVALARALVEI